MFSSIPIKHVDEPLTPEIHHVICLLNDHFECVDAALNFDFFAVFELKSLSAVKADPGVAAIITWFPNRNNG